MIFVTGATGFAGRHLIASLSKWRKDIRVLIPPNQKTNTLPQGIPVEIAISNLDDETNLRAALKDVDTIFHLASDEHAGGNANLQKVDIEGTTSIIKAATELDISRLIFLSQLGAEPSSAYPLLKAKGVAEQIIINSKIPYTIFKTGPIYGTGDHFINRIAAYLASLPFISLLPDKGETLLQPVWINDIVTAMIWSTENPQFVNRTFSIGGPEIISINKIFEMIMEQRNKKRIHLHFPSTSLRLFLLFWEQLNHRLPVSSFDIDNLATNRTTSLDTLTKYFGIQPKRFQRYLPTHRFTSPGGEY